MSQDKIVVTNSAVIINNYEPGDCVKLENNFRLFDPITHSYYYIAMYYDQKEKRLYLPRGIDIWYVEKLLGEQANVLVNMYDKYFFYQDAMIKYLPRDDVQKEALRFMLGKDKYYKNQYKSQLSVNLGTGKGKTYISIATLTYLGIRGIVITSINDWIKQWVEKINEYTDMGNREVYVISGSGNISRLMRMTDKQLSQIRIVLVTHATLRSYADTHGWKSIGELFNKLQIGIKIYDEAHLDFENICMIDYFTNTYRTYYLTATPGKSNEDENRIYQLSFKNVPSIELFDADNDPHTDYIAIFFNSKPSAQQISQCKSKYGMDRNRYTNYVVGQPEFYKLLTVLLDLTNRLAPNPDDKILIYIGTNGAILRVQSWILENYPELYNNVAIYTSIIPKDMKRIALTKRIILSTTKSAGAALDLQGLKVTINLAEPYKSEIISKQSLGRTRADNTYFLDCIDVGFNTCRSFYYKKLPTFEKYAKSCSVVKLNKYELDNRYKAIMEARAPKPQLFTVIEDKPQLFTVI